MTDNKEFFWTCIHCSHSSFHTHMPIGIVCCKCNCVQPTYAELESIKIQTRIATALEEILAIEEAKCENCGGSGSYEWTNGLGESRSSPCHCPKGQALEKSTTPKDLLEPLEAKQESS